MIQKMALKNTQNKLLYYYITTLPTGSLMQNNKSQNESEYWKDNISLLIKLLSVWFIASFGCSILLVDWLDNFQFFGFKLGFWMAQQGAIYIFIVIIFVYSWQMKKLEKKHGLRDDSAARVNKEETNGGDA